MKSWRNLVIMVLLALGITAAAFLYSSNQLPLRKSQQSAPIAQPSDALDSDSIILPPAKRLYGIPVSSYDISTYRVQRGQTLSELLLPHGISLQTVYNISLLSDTLIDERKIKPGNSYSIFSTMDAAPRFFIYEKDPLNYVVISLLPDSIWAQNGKKPIQQRLQFAKGTIETSLWESMLDADANPMLAVELSEIFAWTIDFFGVQQGDRYKVIYEESYVDSVSVGINRILGVWFNHNETDFWGVPFVQDSVRSFFDEEGNSLRKAFLKAPLRFSRISSGFSNSRMHPVLKIRRPHHGVDYAARSGTPVYTVGDGVISKIGYQKRGGGNYVKIKHNSVYSTTYMHLRGFGKGIRQGVYVKQGDLIGYVGSTGLATGPHLDFRFYKNGRAVNPLKVEAPPVEPVHEENVKAYGINRTITMGMLKLL